MPRLVVGVIAGAVVVVGVVVVGKLSNKARIKFQSNCRRPLKIGDIFGVFKVVGFSTTSHSCETEIVNKLTGEDPDASLSSSGESAAVGGGAVAGIVVGVMLIMIIMVGIYKVSIRPKAQAMKVTLSSESGKDEADMAWDEANQNPVNSAATAP